MISRATSILSGRLFESEAIRICVIRCFHTRRLEEATKGHISGDSGAVHTLESLKTLFLILSKMSFVASTKASSTL